MAEKQKGLTKKELSFDMLVDEIISLKAFRNISIMMLTERKNGFRATLGLKKRIFQRSLEIRELEREVFRRFKTLEMGDLAKIVDATGGGFYPLTSEEKSG